MTSSPIVAAIVVAGWLAAWLLAGRVHRLPARPEGDVGSGALVSVVIPARDEAARLPRLLTALAACRRDPHEVPFEVVVVDDHSTDGTADLARASGAQVVTVQPPPGWTGKAWACQQGADHARGEVLVFLDADTEPGPGTIGDLAHIAWVGGGLVSVLPWHRVEEPYEHLSAFPNLVALMGAGTGPAEGPSWWRAPMAFGPALAMRRDQYQAVGGHAAVRNEIVEDVALAGRVADAGLPVSAWSGAPDLRFRMYPEGFARLVEGWTKNLALGAAGTPALRVGLVVLWMAGALLATVQPLTAWPGGLAVYAAYALQLAVLLRPVGGFGSLTALLFPIPLVAFVVLFVRSLYATLLGRARWRGRSVAAGRGR